MSVVDDIKARLDVVDVVGNYVQLKKAGRNYKALCPFHAEKTPSFTVFSDTQTWRCFGQCNEGGDIFSFVMRQEGWDFSEALRELAQQAGVTLETQHRRQPEEINQENRLYDALNIAAEFYADNLAGSIAATYLDQRQITAPTAKTFGIGYAPNSWDALLDNLTQLGFSLEEIMEAGLASTNERGNVYDRFRHRLMIPIRDNNGRVLGFGARAFSDDQQPKYLNSPQGKLFDKSSILYGLDLARRDIRETETAVIMEGYMDVIQAHQQGYRNVVAQMGTALTEQQLQLLSKYANKLILALDTDAAGIKATMRGLETAREALGDKDTYVLDAQGMMRQAGRLNLDIRVLELPHGKDPDEFLRNTPELWKQQIQKALPLAEYVIKVGTADLPPHASIAEREILAHDLLPLLTATEDDVLRQNNVQLLSLRLRLDPKTMVEWASGKTRRSQPTPAAPENRYKKKWDSKREVKAPPPPPIRISAASRLRAAERSCLQMLLQKPQRYFEANRLLREVEAELSGTLVQPLQVSDFSQGDFQAIFALLQRAFQQDELEPLTYLLGVADDDLQESINEILQEPLEAFAKKSEKLYVTELESIQREKEQRPGISGEKDEFPRLVLKMRRERLQQEYKEIFFILSEIQDGGDAVQEKDFTERAQLLPRLLVVLDQKVELYANGFIDPQADK